MGDHSTGWPCALHSPVIFRTWNGQQIKKELCLLKRKRLEECVCTYMCICALYICPWSKTFGSLHQQWERSSRQREKKKKIRWQILSEHLVREYCAMCYLWYPLLKGMTIFFSQLLIVFRLATHSFWWLIHQNLPHFELGALGFKRNQSHSHWPEKLMDWSKGMHVDKRAQSKKIHN